MINGSALQYQMSKSRLDQVLGLSTSPVELDGTTRSSSINMVAT